MADISNKERFRQRYAKRNPDLNMDDEEAYYGSVNQFMDEYEGYEGNSKKMRENLSKSPAFAELMVAARDQDDFDPVVWMVQKQDEIEKQMSENMPASVEGIRAKASEMGLSDDQAEEVIGKMYQVMDDLIVGKLDPSIFEMMAKGMNYNQDVEAAREEGVAEGINKKVTDKLKDLSGKQERPRGRQGARQEKPVTQDVNNPFL